MKRANLAGRSCPTCARALRGSSRAGRSRSAAGTVAHGDAARPGFPLPSALHGPAHGADVWGSGVAFDGTNYLVVWADLRQGVPIVYGARVSPDGTVLDPDGFAISAAEAGAGSRLRRHQLPRRLETTGAIDRRGTRQPGRDRARSRRIHHLDAAGGSREALAFDGTNYLVVWSTEDSVVGARVSPGGTVLDPSGIEIAARGGFTETAPSVAFDGTNFLVVWEEAPCHRILGRLVSQDGVPDVDGSFLISYCYRTRGEGRGPQDGSCRERVDPEVRSGCRVRRRQLPRDLGRLLRRFCGVLREHRRRPCDPRQRPARRARPHRRGVLRRPRRRRRWSSAARRTSSSGTTA